MKHLNPEGVFVRVELVAEVLTIPIAILGQNPKWKHNIRGHKNTVAL
jgi:hypothetical protein